MKIKDYDLTGYLYQNCRNEDQRFCYDNIIYFTLDYENSLVILYTSDTTMILDKTIIGLSKVGEEQNIIDFSLAKDPDYITEHLSNNVIDIQRLSLSQVMDYMKNDFRTWKIEFFSSQDKLIWYLLLEAHKK